MNDDDTMRKIGEASMNTRWLIVTCCSLALSGVAAAETVTVKYRGPVPLDTFQCATIDRSSLVERVCYDAAGIHGHPA